MIFLNWGAYILSLPKLIKILFLLFCYFQQKAFDFLAPLALRPSTMIETQIVKTQL